MQNSDQETVAKQSGLSLSSISKIINGKTTASKSTRRLLASALEVSIEEVEAAFKGKPLRSHPDPVGAMVRLSVSLSPGQYNAISSLAARQDLTIDMWFGRVIELFTAVPADASHWPGFTRDENGNLIPDEPDHPARGTGGRLAERAGRAALPAMRS